MKYRTVVLGLTLLICFQLYLLVGVSSVESLSGGAVVPDCLSDISQPGLVRDAKYPCGVVCFSFVCKTMGQDLSLEESRELLNPAVSGEVSLGKISAELKGRGFAVRNVKVDIDQVPDGSLFIAFVRDSHFVVIRKCDRQTWTVVDLPQGVFSVDDRILRRFWDGTSVAVASEEAELSQYDL